MHDSQLLILEKAEDIFRRFLKVKGQPFGSKSKPYQGISDGKDGVQWNIGLDRDTDEIKLGVNLEGKIYNGWPIAIFIENELFEHKLIRIAQKIEFSSRIFVRFRRDAWQVTYRPPILEQIIGGNEMKLSDLTTSKWNDLLLKAQKCLIGKKGIWKRANQTVTLKNGQKKEMPVTPHLTIYSIVWDKTTPTEGELQKSIHDAFDILKPIHLFVQNQSANMKEL